MRSALLGLAVVLASGCNGGGLPNSDGKVHFSPELAQTTQTNCAVCHDGITPGANDLIFSKTSDAADYQAVMNFIGQSQQQSDHFFSYTLGGHGHLSAADVDTWKQWIADGYLP